MVLAVGDCVQFREEVQATLDDLVQGQKEAQAEVIKILDCPTVREAQQLLLVHQVLHKTDNQILFFSEFLHKFSRNLNRMCPPLLTATAETLEAEEEGCPAADHQRPAAPS